MYSPRPQFRKATLFRKALRQVLNSGTYVPKEMDLNLEICLSVFQNQGPKEYKISLQLIFCFHCFLSVLCIANTRDCLYKEN